MVKIGDKIKIISMGFLPYCPFNQHIQKTNDNKEHKKEKTEAIDTLHR